MLDQTHTRTGENGDDQSLYYREAAKQGQVMLFAQTTDDQTDSVAAVMERVGATGVNEEDRKAASPPARQGPANSTQDGNETLQVVEEQMNVGKRRVQGGGVRVVSRVVERPVQQEVTVRNETVTVARQAVGRNLTAAEADAALAAGERVIETREMNEEAVVSKTARVVEEVVINKTSQDRTETVKGTVRSTQLDVEQLDAGKTTDAERTRKP